MLSLVYVSPTCPLTPPLGQHFGLYLVPSPCHRFPWAPTDTSDCPFPHSRLSTCMTSQIPLHMANKGSLGTGRLSSLPGLCHQSTTSQVLLPMGPRSDLTLLKRSDLLGHPGKGLPAVQGVWRTACHPLCKDPDPNWQVDE